MKEKLLKIIEKNNYSIVSDINSDIFGRFHGIVANKDGKKFFVKALVGSKNYAYRSLLAETFVSKYLSNVTHQNPIEENGYRFYIPLVEKVIIDSEVLCLLSEYIEGIKLIDQPSNIKADILVKTLHLVKRLEAPKTKVKTFKLKSYTKLSLIYLIPLRMLKAIFLTPVLTPKILKAGIQAFQLIGVNNLNQKRIVHADINASNILLIDKNIYLTDWEEAGIGIAEYNSVAPLSVHWTDEVIRKSILDSIEDKNQIVKPLLAYRTLVLLNQNIVSEDSRRTRDINLLNYVSAEI